MTKNYQTALKYLYNLESAKGIKLGLENITTLLDLIGNPQKNFNTIHVAGTNGKGSCSAMIASVLEKAGFKTGLYTSPHLVDFRERIKINGEKIPIEDFSRILNKIKPFILEQTFFEVATAIAFRYFSDREVDFSVLEVGMGGRLDATNVTNPLVSVITNIALEHEEYLGRNLLQIAGEKAGIIKENGIVVTAEETPGILNLIKKICAERNANLICAGEKGDVCCERLDYNLYSQNFYYISGNENKKIKFKIPLVGKHQLNNAVCAIAALKSLVKYNIKIPDDIIYSGLKKTRWLGRCEIIKESPLIVLDAAHNPAGICSLTDTLSEIKEISGYKNLILIIGILKNKNFKKMLEYIAPLAEIVIPVKPNTPLAMDAEVMQKYLIKLNIKNISLRGNVGDAVKYALTRAGCNDAICVTGSLFTVGDAMKFIKKEIKQVRMTQPP